MVMLCVTVDKQPTIGILYAPFSEKTGWKTRSLERATCSLRTSKLIESCKIVRNVRFTVDLELFELHDRELK